MTQAWTALRAAELVPIADVDVSGATYLPVRAALKTGINRLYVRACYDEIADTISGYLSSPKSVVLTGTPGIGKSSFVPYLLWRWANAASSDRPYARIVYQHSDDYQYIDLANGTVASLNVEQARAYRHEADVLFVLDPQCKVALNRGLSAPPTLYVTSPRADGDFRTFDNDNQPVIVFMDLWTLAELSVVNVTLAPSVRVTRGVLEERFAVYGGVVRYVFWWRIPGVVVPVMACGNTSMATALGLVLLPHFDVRTTLFAATVGETDPAGARNQYSQVLFHRQPVPGRLDAVTVLASSSVGRSLAVRVARDQLSALRDRRDEATSRLQRGLWHEAYVLLWLRSEHAIRQGLRVQRVAASSGWSDDTVAIAVRASGLGLHVVQFERVSDLPAVLSEGNLYVPLQCSFPVVDAFFVADESLVGIQATVSTSHACRTGTVAFQALLTRRPDAGRPFELVVALPSDEVFDQFAVMTIEGGPMTVASVRQSKWRVP